MLNTLHDDCDSDVFFKMSIDMLCIAGTDGFLKKVNPAFERVLGYSADELQTKPFFDFIHPDDVAATTNEVKKLKEGISTVKFVNRFRHIDGHYRAFSWSAYSDTRTGLLYSIARDVTEEQEAQHELSQLYDALNAESIIAKTNSNGIITEVNDKFSEISGYSKDELIGQSHRIINSGVHTDDFFNDLWKTISSGKVWAGLIENHRKNGDHYFVHSIITPLHDLEGTIVNYLAIRFDTTEHVKIKEEFHTTLATLNETGSIAKVGGWQLDVTTGELTWTDETFNILEVEKTPDRKPVLPEGLELFTESSKPIIEDAVQRAIKFGRPYSLELEALTAKGNVLWIYTNGKAKIKDGDVTSLSGTIQDINERKLAEIEFGKNEQRYEGIVEGTEDLIIIMNPDGSVKFANHVAEKVFGKSPQECVGLFTFDFVHDDEKKIAINSFRRWIKKKTTKAKCEYRFINVDGSVRVIAMNITLQHDELGEVASLISVGRDFTKRKKTEHDLSKALSDAEEANTAKSDFLASMSHELRTPLNAILGFSDILQNQYFGPLGSKKYIDYASDIYNSGGHLLELVNDILDLSSIEAGQTSINREKLSLEDVIRECVHTATELAKSKGIVFNIEIEPSFPSMWADKRALKQILLNLITNSIKYTQGGGLVSIDAATKNHTFVLSVSDNGFGIAEDKIADITNPFTRNVENPHHSDQGWGLGLSISKSLAHLHHGELLIESEVGVGTSVILKLPMDPGQSKYPPNRHDSKN